MKLCVDAGNTRIKWAVWDGHDWRQAGHVASHEASGPDWSAVQADEVWISNVAGPEVAQRLQRAAVQRGWPVHVVRAMLRYGGLENGYADPARLGVDRWAAAVAAWQCQRGASVVVSCGTATTIDGISAQGRFLGGLILPGLSLMQSSLCSATAQLQMGAAQYQSFPDNTADALFSGAVQATLGAIQRQLALLPQARLLLTGGAAPLLLPHLNDAEPVADLVLQGVRLISQGV